jgi:hypothetical protein
VLGAVLEETLPFVLGRTLQSVVNYLFATVFTAVVIQIVVDIRERTGPRPIGQLLGAISPVFGSLLLVGLLYSLGVGIGLFLLLVPGLYLLTIWAVCAPAVMVERRSATDALGRSQALVRGDGWQVFGVIVSLFLLGVLAAIVIVVPLALALGLAGAIIGAIIIATFLQPLEGLARAVMYFELVRIKEAVAAPGPPVGAPGAGPYGTPQPGYGQSAPPPPPPAPETPYGQPPAGTPPGDLYR